ncbi:MAG TPA: GNAT family N-acetyltransferase [Acidimicrobiia bacterium]|nr:GNAT family N-acetyltransferase [Acidimicrobiia bacterium]
MFEPIRTPRLVIRQALRDDADALYERRNDPLVARYQDWATPYPMAKVEETLAEIAGMDGPEPDEWWMATVEDAGTGEIVGDLAVHPTSGGRTVEIGYTFASRWWGRGLAVEAVSGLVDWLFDQEQTTRLTGLLHPDNRASAMVLERTGFLFEGHTRLSYWLGDEVSDDWIYGMTREDHETWVNRPRHTPSTLQLVPVDQSNEREVFRLRTHKTQEDFVAPMSASFADALFPEVVDGAPVVPWMRGVVADDEYVGFVMLALITEHHPEPYLWRLLIDRLHQRRGIGARVIELISDECRSMGATTLLTSWEEGRGTPAPFYTGLGFVPTGRIVDEETEARKQLV